MSTRDSFEPKDPFRLKVKGWNTIFHANGLQKKSGLAILISDRLDFKLKTVIRDTEGHYPILKGCIQKVDMTIINIYSPNRGAAKYRSQLLTTIKRHRDKNMLIVGGLNTPLSEIDTTPWQKLSKESKASIRRVGPHRYIENTTAQNQRILILF